ncbi:MAG: HAD-IA family hydrolase [Candidatus Lokiarchaeota archaeon]|nr:HAD-IA family hydrolase [Candidatus Lokiarchaeota archaeon]
MSAKKEIEEYKIYGEAQKVKLYKIKHFIFDFGGVLIEKTFVLRNLFDMIEADLNISIPREDNSYIRKIKRILSSGRITTQEFLQKIFEKYYYPFQEKDGALPAKKVNVEYYVELWFDLYSQVTNFSSEMAEIIERLHQADYIVSLMSNTHDIHAKSNFLKGFYDIFDNVFLSNEIGYIKPEMAKYKYVLNKLDTKPKKCIFIDDKIQNLVPARELGIIVIRFESFEKFKKQLNELGVGNISKDLRNKIKKKYKKYKKTKKEYKKAKKEYKKAKKEYLKKKGKAPKRRQEYQRKRIQYRKKKAEYKKQREKKKDELVTKIRVT